MNDSTWSLQIAVAEVWEMNWRRYEVKARRLMGTYSSKRKIRPALDW